jgi:glycosyltransferase involved in cell wall biosynthesis
MYQKTEQEIMRNWKGDIDKPIVSVCCTTYNHEPYIAEAIDSFLMQETDFPFEILIRDDCSTDKTAEIVKEYADKYPQLIKPIYEKENTFSKGVRAMPQLYKIAKGKYIALCEGDDYWIDPLKLQKQVGFLEENDDVSIVHTDFDWLDMKNQHIIKNYYKSYNMHFSGKYEKETYLVNTFMRTMTVCFRKSDIGGYESIRNNEWKLGDVPLFLYLAREKKIGFINQSTGVYRRGEDTVSTSKNIKKSFEFWESTMDIRFFFYDFFNLNDTIIKEKLINQYYDELFVKAFFLKKYKLTIKAFIYKIIHNRIKKSDFKKILIFIYITIRLDKVKKYFKRAK